MQILLIKDSPSHYDTQLEIVRVLESQVREYDLRLILVEAGWGDVSLSYLRDQAPRDKREQVADDYLKKGKISAEEYLDIVSEHPITLWGVDDPRLYSLAVAQRTMTYSEREQHHIQTVPVCELDQKRSAAISKNVIAKMQEAKVDRAVLIASYSLCRFLIVDLRKAGITTEVCDPIKGYIDQSMLTELIAYKQPKEKTVELLYDRSSQEQRVRIRPVVEEISTRLMCYLKSTPDGLYELDGHLFEKVIAEILTR